MVKATFEKAVLHSSKTGTGRTVLLNSQFESGVAILAIKIFDSVKLPLVGFRPQHSHL